MNANMNLAIADHIKRTFADALDKVMDRIGDMLESAAAENQNNDLQVSSAQMTITPKILIQFSTPGTFLIDVSVPVKRIEKVCGESQMELALDPEGNECPDDEQELPGMPEK